MTVRTATLSILVRQIQDILKEPKLDDAEKLERINSKLNEWIEGNDLRPDDIMILDLPPDWFDMAKEVYKVGKKVGR